MNIQYTRLTRVVITGPAEERQKAIEFCWNNGYEIMSSGPKFVRGLMRIDPTRFRIVAERKETK